MSRLKLLNTLHDRCDELCVNLKESPDLRANLLWAVGLRAELQSLVAETLQTLRDDNSFPGLVRRRVKEQAKDLDKEQVHIRETNVSREVRIAFPKSRRLFDRTILTLFWQNSRLIC